MKRINMGILSGMLIVLVVGFFSKKKSPVNDQTIDNSKLSLQDRSIDEPQITTKSILTLKIDLIKKWISKKLRK